MPAWLKTPARQSSGWRRTALVWGGSLAALALVFAGTMWLFEERKADNAPDAMAMSAPTEVAPAGQIEAAPQAAPVAAPKASKLPPLVLLEPAPQKPAMADGGSAAAPAAALEPQPDAATPPPVVAAKPASTIAPPVAIIAPAAPKVAPRAAPLAPKTALLRPNDSVKAPALKTVPAKPQPAKVVAAKTPVQPRSKPAVAKTVQPKLASKAASKKPLPAKRKPTMLAKAKTKAVAGVMLQPARELRDEPAPVRARPPLPGRCLPGELARECSARLGLK